MCKCGCNQDPCCQTTVKERSISNNITFVLDEDNILRLTIGNKIYSVQLNASNFILPEGGLDGQVLAKDGDKLVWISLPNGGIEIPPAAPTNLVAISVSPSQINLTWNDQSDNETSFEVQRSLDELTWTNSVNLPFNSNTYNSTGLNSNTQYYFRVRSRNPYGSSSWSNIANNITQTPIANPMAYWGWKDTNTLPTESEILALETKNTFVDGQTIIANFSGSTIPRYLYMAENISQPIKTRWFVNDLNQAVIETGGTFNTPVEVGQFRVYKTSFATEFNSPVQFRTI